MKPLIATVLFAAIAVSGQALADRGPQHHAAKAHHKAWKEYQKAERKSAKAYEKAYRKWARGEHMPREYLVTRHYVDDYRAYHLDAPPQGYRWVRPYEQDNTYYMVQVATGLISQILGN